MNTKKKPGQGTPSTNRKSDKEELGRTIKRKVISRAKDEESLEEIKEYVYNDKTYIDSLIDTGIINLHDDHE
jgi:hypothetical protein